MEYELATTKVQEHLRSLGYDDLSSMTALSDDEDSNGFIMFRWSFIVDKVDYSIEFYTADNEIDFYDCLNA